MSLPVGCAALGENGHAAVTVPPAFSTECFHRLERATRGDDIVDEQDLLGRE